MTANQIPKKPDERAMWMQYQLKLKRKTMADLARKAGVCRQSVRDALWMPSERLSQLWSQELGIPREHLWPEKYAA